MGAKIFAAVTVVTILTFIIYNTVLMNEKIDEIIHGVEAAESYAEIKEVKERFTKYERFISISVSHEDLMSIEDLFAEYEVQMRLISEEREITKNRLISALGHLRRLSAVNIDSII